MDAIGKQDSSTFLVGSKAIFLFLNHTETISKKNWNDSSPPDKMNYPTLLILDKNVSQMQWKAKTNTSRTQK